MVALKWQRSNEEPSPPPLEEPELSWRPRWSSGEGRRMGGGNRSPVSAYGVPECGLPGPPPPTRSFAVCFRINMGGGGESQRRLGGQGGQGGRLGHVLTWMNWIVSADFPTPPPPTTTSRYFSCTEPSFQPAIEDTSPPPPKPKHQWAANTHFSSSLPSSSPPPVETEEGPAVVEDTPEQQQQRQGTGESRWTGPSDSSV